MLLNLNKVYYIIKFIEIKNITIIIIIIHYY